MILTTITIFKVIVVQDKEFMLRLMRYKRILKQLRSLGLERVFSNNLGDAMDISPALVRKDLAKIEFQGNRRGGYSIEDMLRRINTLFGGEDSQKAVLVGCGNLGRALLNHAELPKEDIKIVAGFDILPAEKEIGGIRIYSMDYLKSIIQELKITIALLTVPAHAAAEVRDRLLAAGIRGILNFAPTELKCPSSCIINTVNIGLEIENLFFMVNSMDDSPEKRQLKKYP